MDLGILGVDPTKSTSVSISASSLSTRDGTSREHSANKTHGGKGTANHENPSCLKIGILGYSLSAPATQQGVALLLRCGGLSLESRDTEILGQSEVGSNS